MGLGFLKLFAAFPFSPVVLSNSHQEVVLNMSGETSTTSATSDILKPWKDRWDDKRIGWHRQQVHPVLATYGTDHLWSKFPAGGARVLVPLCGKTVDLWHMATNRKVSLVTGVEGVRQAIDEFSQEFPDLEIKEQQQGAQMDGFTVFSGNSISLKQGDFFALKGNQEFDVVWDRGSLVAINPSLRLQYAETLNQALTPGGTILLATVDRGDEVTEETKNSVGPPFSINEATLRELYEPLDWVDTITTLPTPPGNDADPPQNDFQELVFVITKKSS